MSEFVVTIGDKKKEVVLSENNRAVIDGNETNYELILLNENSFLLKINDKIFQLSAEKKNSETFSVYIDGRTIETIVRSALQEKAIKLLEQSLKGIAHKTEVKAPMPGMILKIKKQAGEHVQPGESIVILEAMKMENDIHSPASGIIKNIAVAEGNAVEKGTVLFSIE